MPTKKNTNVFSTGKMNRDLDPKVLPNGEYIRMVNGRVNRSEGDGVGTIENVLGNSAIDAFADVNATVLGAVRDNSTDKIFYFVKGEEEDGVFEFNQTTGKTRALLRDNKGILNLNVDYPITGVNVVGEEVLGEDSNVKGTINSDAVRSTKLLLWTDGFNPPRKININRTFARLGGDMNGFTEQEISVEKNPPLNPPEVTAVDLDPLSNLEITQDEIDNFEKEENLREKFVRFAYRWKYEDDEYSVFSPFSPVAFRPGDFEVDTDTGAINGMENAIKAVDINFNTGPREVTEIDLLYKEDGTSTVYVVESFNKKDRKWNNNAVLGAYIENSFTADGKTNEFVLADTVVDTPESPVAVTVGNVTLTITTLYNIETDDATGISTLVLAGNPPDGSEIIVRYKNNAPPFRFSSNKLYRALPDSQLARVFDNVPIRAKSQELIGNRIVYGNYVDRYDLIDVLKRFDVDNNGRRFLAETRTEEIVPKFKVTRTPTGNNLIVPGLGQATLKSDRDYELGIVYLDNLGRQTPVLTSEENTVNIPIDKANTVNKLSVEIESKSPEWATAYRFFIKQNRGAHHNIIPLDYRIQPDDDRWVWFRLSNTDEGKVSEGDQIALKILGQKYYYTEGEDRVRFRVEEIGVKERNFLEVETPRFGEIVLDDDTSERDGEVLDPGHAYTKQQAGLWMRVKNSQLLSKHIEQDTSEIGVKSFARSNNARNRNFRPIQGNITDYKDLTYYYQGSRFSDSSLIDETSVTFSSAIPVAGGVATNIPNADTGPTTGHGPIRVEVSVIAGGKFVYSFWLSPSADSPAVIRQTDLTLGRNIVTGTVFPLVNGITITFTDTATDYKEGDRFVTTYRYADNFMWGCYPLSGDEKSSRYAGPNSIDRFDINGRRAHILIDGARPFSDGINGGSMIELGIADGLGEKIEGDPIVLGLRRNKFLTEDVFYPTFEEMIFEEGLWSAGGANSFDGLDADGNGFGIHQMGFWRGLPIPPTNVFDFGKAQLQFLVFLTAGLPAIFWWDSIKDIFEPADTENYWRLGSAGASDLIKNGESDFGLHTFIQSGVYNDVGNKRKNDKRMESILNFVQGRGDDGTDLNLIKFAFETIPDETDVDVYYEIGETFPCLNGVHFGNEMSESQGFQEIGFNEAGNETQDVIRNVNVDLDYFNCYAWSNGIEVVSIRDEFGTATLEPGAKASTVTSEYQQRENVANLIFSGAFNDTTGVNGLNEFSSSQDALGLIVKEMDTQDGSIQKLFSRNTDLMVFQEDKVNKVLFNKNALFNADGSTNLTSGNPVLGQTTPVAGEFGISKDPESFAVYGNSIFFTDRNRGAVLRYGGDGEGGYGLVEISNYGMRDFFREELSHKYIGENNEFVGRRPLVIGAYDDYHDQYVLSIREPLTDHSVAMQTKPLHISRQAFLSRTDACRFPIEDVSYNQVFEFYRLEEPEGFQVDDVIYTHPERLQRHIMHGDNNWFITVESEVDKDLFSTGAILEGESVQSFIHTDPHLNELVVGQEVTMRYGVNPSLKAFVVSYNRADGSGLGSTLSVRYDDVTQVPAAGNAPNQVWEIDVTINSVVNIDNFGVVRRKLNCVGVLPPNHDAFRVSNASYNSPEEACGIGIVTRIVYHNGFYIDRDGVKIPTPTPGIADSVFDTPYGSDEFFEGDYMKGRTQKKGWYKMFDGAELEDYVILIVQGKVSLKIKCSEVMAGRKRIFISENPTTRREGEIDVKLQTRTCSELPTQEEWHNGDGLIPVAGDTLYQDNFTSLVVVPGYYAMQGGYFIRVNDDGVIAKVDRCSVTICIEDLVLNDVVNNQNQKVNDWVFNGLGQEERALPTITATIPVIDPANINEMILNGDVTSVGEFDEVTYSWYYTESPATLTPRQVLNTGIQVGSKTITRKEVAADYTLTGLKNSTQYRVIFVVKAGLTFVTSEVFEIVAGRTTTPSNTITITDNKPDVSVGDDFTLTSTIVRDSSDAFTQRWTLNGTPISGATDSTYVVTGAALTDAGEYKNEAIFTGINVLSNAIAVTVGNTIPTVSIALTGNSDPFIGDGLTLTADGKDSEGDVLSYQWYLDSIAINGATSATYTIASYSLMNAGDYTCRVTAATGITTPVTSNIITITTSVNGVAEYGAYTELEDTVDGGTPTGIYSYGMFGEWLPATGTGSSSEPTVLTAQTRERMTQEIYAGATASGIRTCELVTLAAGRGDVGVCSNEPNPIGGTQTTENQFVMLNRFDTIVSTEANGGIETRMVELPNSNYEANGTADWGGYIRTGTQTGGTEDGLSYGEYGDYIFNNQETTSDPFRFQQRTRDVFQDFSDRVQDGIRTCNELTAPTTGGVPGFCTNPISNIGETDTEINHFVETVGSISLTPTVENGGIEIIESTTPNPNFRPTATYVLSATMFTGLANASVSSVPAISGSSGEVYTFEDPEIIPNDGYDFVANNSPVFTGDDLSGVFSNANVVVNRSVSGAIEQTGRVQSFSQPTGSGLTWTTPSDIIGDVGSDRTEHVITGATKFVNQFSNGSVWSIIIGGSYITPQMGDDWSSLDRMVLSIDNTVSDTLNASIGDLVKFTWGAGSATFPIIGPPPGTLPLSDSTYYFGDAQDVTGTIGKSFLNGELYTLEADVESRSTFSATANNSQTINGEATVVSSVNLGFDYLTLYNGDGENNTVFVSIGGIVPSVDNSNIDLTVSGVVTKTKTHYLAVGSAGGGIHPGAGGVSTSWGSSSGGFLTIDGVITQRSARPPAELTVGTLYEVVIGGGRTVGIPLFGAAAGLVQSEPRTTIFGSANAAAGPPSFVSTTTDGNSSPNGSSGGGSISVSNDTTVSFAEAGGSAGNYGYPGGSAQGSNATNIGGPGGAAGPGESVDSNDVSVVGAGGLGLSVNITGTSETYGGHLAGGSYGTPGVGVEEGESDGALILRVPTESVGIPTGEFSSEIVGDDTVITWFGKNSNQTYTA